MSHQGVYLSVLYGTQIQSLLLKREKIKMSCCVLLFQAGFSVDFLDVESLDVKISPEYI